MNLGHVMRSFVLLKGIVLSLFNSFSPLLFFLFHSGHPNSSECSYQVRTVGLERAWPLPPSLGGETPVIRPSLNIPSIFFLP